MAQHAAVSANTFRPTLAEEVQKIYTQSTGAGHVTTDPTYLPPQELHYIVLFWVAGITKD